MSPEELRSRRATPGHCPWCGDPLADGAETVNDNSPQSTHERWVHKRCQTASMRIAHGPHWPYAPATVAEYAYDDIAERDADGWKADEGR